MSSSSRDTQPRRPRSEPPPIDHRIGTILVERYRVCERLAAGAMGVVYRGQRLGLDRPVAIKFIADAGVAADELRRRFAIEARAASRLAHPNCVPVIDFGLDGGAPFIVMDFVDGEPLRAVLDRGPLTVTRGLEIARQVLAGLAHAHRHGVIHRDVKPANILVWSDPLGEHVQLTDFGLAKLDALTISQDVAIGTPSYMAPEQTLGEVVDARADVYAAGILVFELLTHRRPFVGATAFETMRQHRDQPVPWFAAVAPERLIAPELEGVVRRALAKHPDDRYASAVEFAAALEAAATAARDASDEVALDELLAPALGRGRWLARASWLAVVGMCGAAGWWMLA